MIYTYHVVWEDSGYTVLARILGHDGAAITQSDVSGTIAWTIAERSAPATEVTNGTVVVADTVFDTLQTADSRWSRDTTGFNFAAAMGVDTVPTGNKTYHLRYTFTPSGGGAVYRFPVVVKTRNLLGI
jgi:hypothetical protein